MSDNVNHPSHYTTGGVECIDGIPPLSVKRGLKHTARAAYLIRLALQTQRWG